MSILKRNWEIKLKVDDLLEGYNPKNVQNLESFSDKVKAGFAG